MSTEKTAVENLYERAQWAKRQNTEFMKNFKSMNSIIRVYKALPADYDKSKSLLAYLKKNKTAWSANRLKLILNSEFGFRHFTDAPHRYTAYFALRKYGRVGSEIIEVKCTVTDHCSLYRTSLYESREFGAVIITIKDLGDARRAADKLLAGVIEQYGNDYETIYGTHLREAMKHSYQTDNELKEACEIPGL